LSFAENLLEISSERQQHLNTTQTNLQRKNKTAEDILVLNEQTAHNAAAATHALLIMSQTTA
jgi:hypothetical protein